MIDYKKCQEIFTSENNKTTSVEFILGTQCQNSCAYCYRRIYQYDNPISPISISKLRLYFNNAKEMGLIHTPIILELFGGDPIVDLIYFKNLLSEFKDDVEYFLVPSNGRILENLKDEDIDELIEASGKKLSISLSVDSPIQEPIKRPLSLLGQMQGFTDSRNWDRLIYLAKKYGWGFHPMFDFNNVDEWFNIFKYFVDNEVAVYLLEVRHPVTDNQAIKGAIQIGKIMKFVKEYKIDFKFNAIDAHIIPRGLGCSALTTLTINTDGKTYFCHRLLKERYAIADLVTKEIDPTKYIMYSSGFDHKNSHYCMNCPLRISCGGYCVGMVDEYWDRYGVESIPILSICKYYLLKSYILTQIDEGWKSLNLDLDKIYHMLKDIYNIDPDEVLKEI